MVNYRVEDLHAVVTALKAEGCNVLEKIDVSGYGKFAWVIDPARCGPAGFFAEPAVAADAPRGL